MYGAFTLFGRLSQNLSTSLIFAILWSATPGCSHPGLGSPAFARRYLRVRCFFLFLPVLRCFSSRTYLPAVMDWRRDAWSSSMRVPPFRHPRIDGYVLLPAAFRSLSRLSSARSAKASAPRPCSLDRSFRSFSIVLNSLLSLALFSIVSLGETKCFAAFAAPHFRLFLCASARILRILR